AHAELDVDVGEPPTGPVEDVGEVGAVHHRVWSAETLGDPLAKPQGGQRPARPEGVDVDTSRREGTRLQLAVEAEPVEDAPCIGADLKTGAELGQRLRPLQYDHG